MCYQEFPLWKTAYNLVAASALLTASALASASMGAFGLAVFLIALCAGMALTLATVCNRCSYFGHRCALGWGKLAPRIRRRARTDAFCRTPSQLLSLLVFAAAPVTGLVGAVRMAREGAWLWPLLYLVSVLALLLPHPRWMCRTCAQRERGPCPVGRVLVRPARAG